MAKRSFYEDIWPIDRRSAMAPKGWRGWPGGKKFALVLTHDVECHEGVKKTVELAHIDMKFGFRSCFNFVPGSYEPTENLRRSLVADGFEIGVHGFNHKGNLYVSRRQFVVARGKLTFI
jgi:peptidoglycan/xylan/chitin deacetylase (PgdA/CDA1 family)